MTERPYRCPRCDKLLGKARLLGDLVIIETWCKRCNRLVECVVKQQEAA